MSNQTTSFTRTATPVNSDTITAESVNTDLNALIVDYNLKIGSDKIDSTVLAAVWPVGSIFIAVVSTNPATLLGFGTWTAFGAGKTLVGFNSGETEFDTAEETGGEKTHALTEAELASHTHGVTDPTHRHTASIFRVLNNTNYSGTGNNLLDAASPTQVVTDYAATGISIVAAGSGTAHNNLQPYITVYMWKRTA